MLTHIDSWRAFLVAEGRAPNSITAYLRDVRRFARAYPVEPGAVTRGMIREHVDAMLRAGAAPASVNRCIASLRQWFAWCVAQGLAAYNPADGVNRITVPIGAPQALSDAQVHALLSAVRRSGSLRDQALLGVLLDCGLRRSEAASLLVGDVLIDGQDVSLRLRAAKNAGVGTLPVSGTTAKILRQLVRGRAQEEPLFISHRGGALTPHGIYQLLASYGRRCGVDVHPHQLRHTHANRLIATGAPLTVVQARLRHKRGETTLRYTKPTAEQVRAAVDKASVW